MESRSRSRGLLPRLAGLVLLLDGVIGLLAAAMFLLVSTVFPPVAAVEGRPPVEQSWFLEALLSLVIAIGGLWAGQRLVRGVPGARLVGSAIAGLVAVLLAAFLLSSGAGSPEAAVGWAGIAGVHAIAAIVLLRAPSSRRTAGEGFSATLADGR